ncbi:uncharacterized protein LOC143254467 [Tachypleus tridentatus]|uniref:uncharacterized protein LOC143254467 n=1 Tax=Tachypleus tridentatus TaxID=6853 RepID=UPI003FD4363C
MVPIRIALGFILCQEAIWVCASKHENKGLSSTKLHDYNKDQKNPIENLSKSVIIYEKRAQFDSPENYGKGPWELFTYGFGVKYGSNPFAQVEKGFGYVKALGREYCQENPAQCPGYTDTKPFIYHGVKEPYWGYRPRSSPLHDLPHGHISKLDALYTLVKGLPKHF